MTGKKIELTLPAFAFLEDSGHDGNTLEGRNVIMHIRSASVVEILERDKCGLKEGGSEEEFHIHQPLWTGREDGGSAPLLHDA